jgi:hypothetical protein
LEEGEATGLSQSFRRKESFKDRDYIKTGEGLIFCVIGDIHPPKRITAYLKYVAEKTRKPWRILPYYSLPHVEETLSYLEKNHPKYLFSDRFSELKFSAVPRRDVKIHYRPEQALRRIMFKRRDKLEDKALRLARLISKTSNVGLERFGVSGSILLGIHNIKYSDIDLLVYGLKESLKVKEALLNLYREAEQVKKFSGNRLKAWCKEKSMLHPLSIQEAEEIYRRTWNRGTFGETVFSIHPVRADYEVKEKYGSEKFEAIGIVEAEATIVEAEESIFLPAKYEVSKVKVLSGPKLNPINEIVSYEGLYSGIFCEGEKVKVRGLLEKVSPLRAEKGFYYRILVGSRVACGEDYIKAKL